MQTFSPEFVDALLFKNGLELKNYVIHRTPVSETLSCVNDDSEFDLLISNNELWSLAKQRLIELGVRVVEHFMKPRVPAQSDFAPGTEFLVFEFRCPVAKSPSGSGVAYVAWHGGVSNTLDPAYLKIDNNWPADSFESWAALVERSLKASPGTAGQPNP